VSMLGLGSLEVSLDGCEVLEAREAFERRDHLVE